ncbi:MAG: SPOR domain-containing protein [Gemmatimonadetes bacterium]|nr:SPOR domain-containing protein [Gemmatimonadota bacterium]
MLLALAALTTPASAQSVDPDLARTDSLIAAGRTGEARQLLAGWQAGHGASPGLPSDVRAHALFLSGRLATGWSDAEPAYASLALSYPTSPHAPAALLRLGQGLVTVAATRADGSAVRAIGYLERLTNDYPNAPDRAAAWLWLGRAYHAAQRLRPACDALATAAGLSADRETGNLIRDERARFCAPAAPGLAATRLYGVQIGAFGTREAAEQIVTRLSARGIESRIVTLEGGSLFRVRTGRFTDTREAESLARRIREAGFEAIVIDDVSQERAG